MDEKQTPKIGEGKAGPGRKKGVPNKVNGLLKDAILQAANEAGGEGGIVAYLRLQAWENPGPFMALIGKVLPTQVTGPGENGEHVLVNKIQREIVRPKDQDA